MPVEYTLDDPFDNGETAGDQDPDWSVDGEEDASPSPLIDYAARLNEEQHAAVTAPPGPLLVIAGAGSGKTRTLTYRVAWLVEKGVAPENILLLTFTNKAASEMLKRVGELLPHDLTRLWGGTFHSVGNRILRRAIDLLGYDRSFSILDRDDSTRLMKACMDEAGIKRGGKAGFPKPDVVIDVISMGVNTCTPFDQLFEDRYEHLAEHAEPMGKLRELYFRKKKESNAVDFDDLLSLPLKVFEGWPEILERYQQQFRHLLVDEYQDTNAIQSRFIDLLGARHHCIMAVGDDAQSIYSWRGANYANIMSFPERHPGTTLLKLETNYRSIPEILELANAAISNNSNQYEKNLQATRQSGVKPALVELANSRDQALFVAQRATQLVEDEGLSLSDIAVLYRSHFHCMELQMELTRRQIPFHITSGLRFFEQAHVKDVAAHLRLLVNPGDEISFRRLALLLPGVGEKTAVKMFAQVRGGTPWNRVKVPEKARTAWDHWGEVYGHIRENDVTKSPSLHLSMIIDALYEDYTRVTYTNYTSRLDDLGQLQSFAETFEDTSEFLGQMALLSNVDGGAGERRRMDSDAIRLSTVHQAKGLEYKVVFVLMLCDGLFPSFRSLESLEGEEEERRLFYVAVTRAQDELYLAYPRMRSLPGQGDQYQERSRFLDDFSHDLCNTWRVKGSSNYGSWS